MNLTMPWTARDEVPSNGSASKLEELKRIISEKGREAADQAAVVARDAGDKTSSATRDVAESAGSTAQQLLRGAAEIGAQIAATTRESARDLGDDARATVDDLGKVRLTTEPEKRGPDFMPGIGLLAGFGAGVALMYFFDPDRGNRRRALLRDQISKWMRIARETISGKAEDMGNRTRGVMIETRKQVKEGIGSASEGGMNAETSPSGPAASGEGEFASSTFSGVGVTTPAADTWPSGTAGKPAIGGETKIGAEPGVARESGTGTR